MARSINIDSDAYLKRIGLKYRPANDEGDLLTLQRAHRLAIPFENLDIILGHGINLEPEHLFDKLVTRNRGGYCFEQNTLFQTMLTQFGFNTRPLLARVWLFATQTPPRTHQLNLVQINGQPWIADVGFGGSYCPPMRLIHNEVAKGPDGVVHRLVEHDQFGWMLECRIEGEFKPEYSFTLDEVAKSDIAMSNHWTATWPESRFVKNMIATICLPTGMASLVNLDYTRISGNERVTNEIKHAQILQIRLGLIFGIRLSDDEISHLGLIPA